MGIKLLGNRGSGAGLLVRAGGRIQLTNAVFSGNASSWDGALVVEDEGSSAVVTNASFTGNTARYGDAVYAKRGGSIVLRNCIVWNSGDEALREATGGTIRVEPSIVEGGAPGPGDLDADPRFRDADGADHVPGTADDDWRLPPDSPAIDVGSNDLLPVGITTDLHGRARFSDHPRVDMGVGAPPIVDMGACEATWKSHATIGP